MSTGTFIFEYASVISKIPNILEIFYEVLNVTRGVYFRRPVPKGFVFKGCWDKNYFALILNPFILLNLQFD